MRFMVGRDALGEAVAFVSRALATRPVVPVLSGMLLDAGDDSLTLSCFDYEVSARVRIDAEVTEPGTALVPGRLLAEITRSLPARPAEFSDQAEDEVVSLTCGRAEFGLVCLPVAEYPVLPAVPAPVGVIDGGALASAVAQVAAAASRDDTLPMLTAICVDVSGDVLTLAATDRYRLAASEAAFSPADPDVRAVALVPARIMVEAARQLAADGQVTIAFGGGGQGGERPGTANDQPRPADGLISFESGARRITARLIAGEFIKYRSRFPEEFGCHADLPAGPVIEAVRRAALVADRASPIRLSFRPDQVVIEAHAEGRARAAETVTAEFAGDQPVISFDPHYLLDGLSAAAAAGTAAGGPAGQAHGGAPGDGEAGERPAADEAAGHSAGGDPADGGPAGGSPAGGSPAGGGPAGGGPAGGGPAGGGPAGGGPADGGEPAEAGRIRVEFNTPAKPALITWVGADGHQPTVEGGRPAFRYLVVPLRVPERNLGRR